MNGRAHTAFRNALSDISLFPRKIGTLWSQPFIRWGSPATRRHTQAKTQPTTGHRYVPSVCAGGVPPPLRAMILLGRAARLSKAAHQPYRPPERQGSETSGDTRKREVFASAGSFQPIKSEGPVHRLP